MKEAILDTSFILTCVKEKIDFFEWFLHNGIQPLIPKEVIKEIEGIIKSKQKLKEKETAVVSLAILEKNKFKKISLNSKVVDDGIKNFADENPGFMVATLDKGLKKRLKNKLIYIRDKTKLEIS
jgi:rRNA-processing protein FCF1